MRNRGDFSWTLGVVIVAFVLIIVGCGGGSSGVGTPNKYLTYVADSTQGPTPLLRGLTTWSDMTITARVMFTPGVNYISLARASAGLTNFHQLVLTRSSMYVYQAIGATTSPHGITAIPVALQDNHWYTLKFVINGSTFTGYVDGVKYTDYTLADGETQGNVFILSDDDRTTAGRHASWDDIVVTDSGSTTYFSDDFQSYPATANWTPNGGWNPNAAKGTFSIVTE